MTQSNDRNQDVAAPHSQGDRGDCGGPRGSDLSADELGARRLSGPPGQDRRRQYAGRPLRHFRPLDRRRDEQVLGGSVIVENKGGAGGNIGMASSRARNPTATPSC